MASIRVRVEPLCVRTQVDLAARLELEPRDRNLPSVRQREQRIRRVGELDGDRPHVAVHDRSGLVGTGQRLAVAVLTPGSDQCASQLRRSKIRIETDALENKPVVILDDGVLFAFVDRKEMRPSVGVLEAVER